MQYAQKCENCESRMDCQKAFGAFWMYKSNWGKGCLYPFGTTEFKPKPNEEFALVRAPIRLKAPVRPKQLKQQEFF